MHSGKQEAFNILLHASGSIYIYISVAGSLTQLRTAVEQDVV